MPKVNKPVNKGKAPVKPAPPPPKPPASLEHFIQARIKYVGWIQSLQTNPEYSMACLSNVAQLALALAAAYDLLMEHDHQAWRWYGEAYQPDPPVASMRSGPANDYINGLVAKQGMDRVYR